MASTTRLPLALEVFRTLQRYPVIQPRRMREAPIGCRLYLGDNTRQSAAPAELSQSPATGEAGEGAVQYGELFEDEPDATSRHHSTQKISTRHRFSLPAAHQSLRHLYHDLGVLVFAGCNADQTRRIGDILKIVARQGGIGGTLAGLMPERKTKKQREKKLRTSELNVSLSSIWEGTVLPQVLIGRASANLRAIMDEDLVVAGLERSDYELRVTEVNFPNIPMRKGVMLFTDSGLRRLPVDSYSSVRHDWRSGHLKGKVQFLTAGVGGPVGTVHMSYAVLRLPKSKDTDKETNQDDKESSSRPGQLVRPGPIEVRGVSTPNPEAHRQAMEALLKDVLQPLWQLEREIWEDRAIETAKLSVTPFEGI